MGWRDGLPLQSWQNQLLGPQLARQYRSISKASQRSEAALTLPKW